MEFPAHIPFVKALGFELVSASDGEAVIRLPLREDLLNGFMVTHGGVSMTLLDVAMAQAARSVNRDQPGWGPGVVTIEMKTSFLRAGEGDLRAEGQLVHRTATLAFCEGRIYNAKEELIAHATGTFKYLRKQPVPAQQQRHLQGAASD